MLLIVVFALLWCFGHGKQFINITVMVWFCFRLGQSVLARSFKLVGVHHLVCVVHLDTYRKHLCTTCR